MRCILLACLIFLSWNATAYGDETAVTRRAIFSGGCFWCMQSEFSDTPGVVSAISGYTGGTVAKPTYEQVSSGITGHAESVEVIYDPLKVTYEQLLAIYWSNIDPTDENGQFYDRGTQYRTIIFYTDDTQHALAEASKKRVEDKLKTSIYTQILPSSEFYAAEEYHQHYSQKNPLRYNAYKTSSGRKDRLKRIWGQ